MTDLDAIKARVQVLQRHAGSTDYAAQVIADSIALVAEVERLQQVQPKRDYYASLGAAQERAAVVAWLRAESYLTLYEASPWDISDRIERGEHRREGAP